MFFPGFFGMFNGFSNLNFSFGGFGGGNNNRNNNNNNRFSMMFGIIPLIFFLL